MTKSHKQDYIDYRINTAKETLNAANQFTLHFIKTGLIDKKLAGVYVELFDYRQEADYADFVDFNKNKTLPLFTPVEELLQKIENLLNEKLMPGKIHQ